MPGGQNNQCNDPEVEHALGGQYGCRAVRDGESSRRWHQRDNKEVKHTMKVCKNFNLY